MILPSSPAIRLCCCFVFVLAVQWLGGLSLLIAILVLAVLDADTTARCVRLALRARWLFASLMCVLGWGVAGTPLWESAGVYSPTLEGLVEGVTQAGRLLLVMYAVAALMQHSSLPELMSGGRTLLSPLQALGLDVDRAVVRLALALRYAEEPQAGGWRTLLANADVPGPEAIRLVSASAGRRDWLMLAGTVFAGLVVVAA